jgi:hypothetical protein
MAERDFENIQIELSEIGDIELTELFDMPELENINEEENNEEEPEIEEEHNIQYDNNIMNFNENYIFKTNNKFDIPELKEDMFCDTIPVETINTSSDEDLTKDQTNLIIYRNCALENII